MTLFYSRELTLTMKHTPFPSLLIQMQYFYYVLRRQISLLGTIHSIFESETKLPEPVETAKSRHN